MQEQPTTAPPPAGLCPRDLVIAAVVTVVCAVLWWLVPADWSDIHADGKGFLSIFVVTSGLAALLTSHALLGRGLRRTSEEPAVWLGIQVLFWNPLAYRAVLALVQALGAPESYAGVVALAGLVLLGLPTSLLGAAFCRSPSWTVVYLARALACLVTTWVPLLPALIFLHVLLFAQLVTWNRYGRLHRYAVALVLAEQFLAFLWVFLFGQFE